MSEFVKDGAGKLLEVLASLARLKPESLSVAAETFMTHIEREISRSLAAHVEAHHRAGAVHTPGDYVTETVTQPCERCAETDKLVCDQMEEISRLKSERDSALTAFRVHSESLAVAMKERDAAVRLADSNRQSAEHMEDQLKSALASKAALVSDLHESIRHYMGGDLTVIRDILNRHARVAS